MCSLTSFSLVREEDTTGDLKWSSTAFGHNLQIDRVRLVYKLEKTGKYVLYFPLLQDLEVALQSRKSLSD